MENKRDGNNKDKAFRTFPAEEFSSLPKVMVSVNETSFDALIPFKNKPSQISNRKKLKKLKKLNKLIKSIKPKNRRKCSGKAKHSLKKPKITKRDLFSELKGVPDNNNDNSEKFDFGFIDTNGVKPINIENDSDSENAGKNEKNDKNSSKTPFSPQNDENEEWRAFASSRYFAPKHCVIERDNELKRFRPVFDAANNNNCEITETSHNEVTLKKGKTLSEDALNSISAEKWKCFVNFQNERFSDSRRKASLPERKIAILERALETLPHDMDLLKEYLIQTRIAWSYHRTALIWDMVLAQNSLSAPLWRCFVDFTLFSVRYEFARASATNLIKSAFLKLKKLKSEQKLKNLKNISGAELAKFSQIEGDLFLRLISLEKAFGRAQCALVLVQALAEANIRFNRLAEAKDYVSFEAFWECGFDRMGSVGHFRSLKVTAGEDGLCFGVGSEESGNEIGGGEDLFFEKIRPFLVHLDGFEMLKIIKKTLETFGLIKSDSLEREVLEGDEVELIEKIGCGWIKHFKNDSNPELKPLETIAFFSRLIISIEKSLPDLSTSIAFFALNINLILNAYREHPKIDLNCVEKALKRKLEILYANDDISVKNRSIEADLWLLYIETAKLNKKNIFKLLKRTLNFLKSKNLAAQSTSAVAWGLFRLGFKAKNHERGLILDALMAVSGFKSEFKETSTELKAVMALKKLRGEAFIARESEQINYVFLGYAALEIILSGVKAFLGNIFSTANLRFTNRLNAKTAAQIAWLVSKTDFKGLRIVLGHFINMFPFNVVLLKLFIRVCKEVPWILLQKMNWCFGRENYNNFAQLVPLCLAHTVRVDKINNVNVAELNAEIYRTRKLFEKAFEDQNAIHSAFLWRLWFRFEIIVNRKTGFDVNENTLKLKLGQVRDIANQRNSTAFRVFLRAVKNCPWAKKIWQDGLAELSEEFDDIDRTGLESLAKQTGLFN